MRVLAAVGLPTRAPSRATTLTSTRHRRVAARCVRSNDDAMTRRIPRAAVDDDDASSSTSSSSSSASSAASALAASVVAGALAPATAAAAAVDSLASRVPGIDGDAAIAAAGVVVALVAAGVVASRSAGNKDGSNRRRATSIPGATPNLRTTGAFDDTRGRNYLIAPPPLFPLVPAFARRTFRHEVDPGRVWFFEQKQGIGLGLNVSVNVRMTVVKLRSGGLWVHAPIAPTDECVALLKELDAPVEHVVLPTTLFEHKIFVGPFQRKFPDATCYVAPDQWSWPVNLPPTFFGIFKDGVLGVDTPPWADEFEYELLTPPALGVASYVAFSECAFFHKDTKTLLVTDAVVYVSDNVPDAIPDRDLLESGDDDSFTIGALKLLNLFDIRDKARSRTRTSADMNVDERLKLGWQRNALQALYFGPSNLLDPDESWAQITNRMIVAPVVSTLVYENVPLEVQRWARRVGRWNFTRVVPCHFDAPIKAGPREWNAAFGFLPTSRPDVDEDRDTRFGGKNKNSRVGYYPDEDMVLLRGVGDFLLRTGVIFTDETRPKVSGITGAGRPGGRK